MGLAIIDSVIGLAAPLLDKTFRGLRLAAVVFMRQTNTLVYTMTSASTM